MNEIAATVIKYMKNKTLQQLSQQCESLKEEYEKRRKEYEYLDISPKKTNKNTALNILGNYLNINRSEMMSVGDNLNDYDMIKNSGIGVAVANSYDDLKSVAKYVTKNNVENAGFAEAIYKFL